MIRHLLILLVLLGPFSAPLLAFFIGCLIWGRSFARRQWHVIAWYYGSFAVVIAIAGTFVRITSPYLQVHATVFLPATFILICYYIGGLVLGGAFPWGGRDQRIVLDPACRKCRYNLSGNTSGICPECGEAIPPDQQKMLRRYFPGRNTTTPSRQ